MRRLRVIGVLMTAGVLAAAAACGSSGSSSAGGSSAPTGVLTIDNQSAMVQRLSGLLPVAASSGKDGVILLSELNSTQ